MPASAGLPPAARRAWDPERSAQGSERDRASPGGGGQPPGLPGKRTRRPRAPAPARRTRPRRGPSAPPSGPSGDPALKGASGSRSRGSGFGPEALGRRPEPGPVAPGLHPPRAPPRERPRTFAGASAAWRPGFCGARPLVPRRPALHDVGRERRSGKEARTWPPPRDEFAARDPLTPVRSPGRPLRAPGAGGDRGPASRVGGARARVCVGGSWSPPDTKGKPSALLSAYLAGGCGAGSALAVRAPRSLGSCGRGTAAALARRAEPGEGAQRSARPLRVS